jgi:hypothetical protein
LERFYAEIRLWNLSKVLIWDWLLLLYIQLSKISKYLKPFIPKVYNYINNKKYIDNRELVDNLIIKWKNQIYPKFKVHVPSNKLRYKLIKYLSTFDKEKKDFYLNQKISNNFPIRDFIENREYIELDFYTLVLDKNMEPIEVINSDISFILFFLTLDNNDL